MHRYQENYSRRQTVSNLLRRPQSNGDQDDLLDRSNDLIATSAESHKVQNQPSFYQQRQTFKEHPVEHVTSEHQQNNSFVRSGFSNSLRKHSGECFIGKKMQKCGKWGKNEYGNEDTGHPHGAMQSYAQPGGSQRSVGKDLIRDGNQGDLNEIFDQHLFIDRKQGNGRYRNHLDFGEEFNEKPKAQLHVPNLTPKYRSKSQQDLLLSKIGQTSDDFSAADLKPPTNSLQVSPDIRRNSFNAISHLQIFTEKQKQRLRQSWDRLGKQGPSGIGSMIFRRVFERRPAVRELFGFGNVPTDRLVYDPTFVKHARVFVSVIDGAIKNLDDLDAAYGPLLSRYGERHVRLKGRGFKPEYWDVFAECMTESAMEWVGPGRYKDAVRPWALLMSYIVDKMRTGYLACLRQSAKPPQQIKSSSDALVAEKQQNFYHKGDDGYPSDLCCPDFRQTGEIVNADFRQSGAICRSSSRRRKKETLENNRDDEEYARQ